MTDSETAGKTPQRFERNACATLNRVTAVFCQRGGEYADTWKTCQFLTMKAVAQRLGSHISPEHFRALATAAFVDMKYQRMEGGYKDDNVVDGIAYSAYLAQEMAELLSSPA
jgi:hypothetical protein